MEQVFFLAYSVWAFYAGYQTVSGRSEWLDTQAPLNIIAKLALSYVVGIFIGAYQLLILLLKFLGVISRM